MSFWDLIAAPLNTIIDSIGNAIDKNVTSDEERLAKRNELEQILEKAQEAAHQYESQFEDEVTKRWQADDSADSWLAKNTRPIIALSANFVLLGTYAASLFGLPPDKLAILQAFLPVIQTMVVTIDVAYFGSRGFEKVTKMKVQGGDSGNSYSKNAT